MTRLKLETYGAFLFIQILIDNVQIGTKHFTIHSCVHSWQLATKVVATKLVYFIFNSAIDE